MLRYIVLIFLSFLSASCFGVEDNSSAAWTLDFHEPVATLDGVHTLIGFQDQLLLFNIQKKSLKGSFQRPGIYQQGALKISPEFTSYATISAHTRWNDLLVVAGALPFSNLEKSYESNVLPRLSFFDGQTWQEMGDDFRGRVSSMVQWKGDLIVAGQLSIKDKPELTSLARWDGHSWQEVLGQPQGGGEPRIFCLTVHEGNLVVGGVFAELGGAKVRNLASYDGAGWVALGGGPNGLIGNIVSFQGDIFATGRFSCIGGKEISSLARWDGQQWHSLVSDHGSATSRVSFLPIKILATPKGLFMAGSMEKFTGIENQQVACWRDQTWDTTIPTIHQVKETLEWTDHYLAKSNGGRTKVVSQPRPWSSEPYFRPEFKVEQSFVRDLAWHQNSLVLYTKEDSGCSISDRNPRLLTLDGDSWKNLLAEPQAKGVMLGSYQNGTLYLLGNRETGWELVNRKNNNQISLGRWLPNMSHFEPPRFQVQGDTIIAVGRFDNFAGLRCHHAALYDGNQWHPMGDGIPFDDIQNVKFHPTRDGLFLTASFRNYGFRDNSGLMKWTGRQWKIIELDYDAYAFSHITNDGTWIYRSKIEKPVSIRLMSPTHEWQSFLADSRPFIQRWNGESWEKVWQGDTGQISRFVTLENTLWATLSNGRDANLLKLEGDQWTTISKGAFAGRNRTDINSLQNLMIFQGKPVAILPQYQSGYQSKRLAVLIEGRWYWFGPGFKHLSGLRVAKNQLLLTARFVTEPPHRTRGATLKWDGPFGTDEPVPMIDLAMLDQWEITCQASDQNDRPDLDLPWPKGFKKTMSGKDVSAYQRAGWHLSVWPDSLELDSVIETPGKNTIALKPNRREDLNFFFWWDPQQAGLFEFEYRLIDPDCWNWDPDSTINFPGGLPFNHDEGLKQLPSISVSINNLSQFLTLWSADQEWRKISIPFGVTKAYEVQQLVFKGGKTLSGSGQVEFRNIRVRKKNKEDYRELAAEVSNILQDYSGPETARKRLDVFGERMKQAARKNDNWVTSKCLEKIYLPGRLVNELLSREETRAMDSRNAHADLRLVVDNYTNGKINSGWVPGGGLYVTWEPFPRFLEPDGYFHKLNSDSIQIGSINGLILDMRGSRFSFDGTAQNSFKKTNQIWSFFAGKDQPWGQIDPGPSGSLRVDLTVKAADDPWEKVPVVILVSENTPGKVVMLLNALPNITTIGRPSAPVQVPTRAHLLSNGQWGYFPAGRVFDISGKEVSLCRISPNIEIPLNATWDAAIREAMEVLGLKPDPESTFCPMDNTPPGG